MSRQLELFPSRWLPPQEYILIGKNEKLPTPLDELGLVDIAQLITDVKTTLAPEFILPTTYVDAHHFYWPKSFYPHSDSSVDPVNPALFRNQSVNRGLIPIVFHNWIHEVTLPPVIPSLEVMEYRTEAWQVAKLLFDSVKNVRKFERRYERLTSIPYEENLNDIDEDILLEILDNFLNTADSCVERMRKVPVEFRLIDPDEPIGDITLKLGELVAKPSLTLIRAVA